MTPIHEQPDSNRRCKKCEEQTFGTFVFCPRCWNLLMACRISLRLLLLEHFIVQIDDHGWFFQKGAQDITELLWDTIEQYMPEGAKFP